MICLANQRKCRCQRLHLHLAQVQVSVSQIKFGGNYVFLIHIPGEFFFKLLLRGVSHPFLQKISVSIQEIDFGLVAETQRALKIECVRVIGIQIREFDPAEVFCFKPMNHGRHGTAGASGEAEEFHELDLPGSQAYSHRIGGFEIRPAGGRHRKCRWREVLCGFSRGLDGRIKRGKRRDCGCRLDSCGNGMRRGFGRSLRGARGQ